MIIDAINLLGDSLYILRPLDMFMQQCPDKVLAVVVDGGLAFDLFRLTFPTVRVCRTLDEARSLVGDVEVLKLAAGDAASICFEHAQTHGRMLHISEGYALMLGLPLGFDLAPLRRWHSRLPENDVEQYILLSPFSRSCTVHSTGVPNKTLTNAHWEYLIRFLRKLGYPIKIIGGPNDYMRCSIALNDYVSANAIGELEQIIRNAKMLISVDNGIGHIASTINIPVISLWPKVSSVELIAPLWAPRTLYLTLDPSKVEPVQILAGLRKFVSLVLDDKV